MIHLVMKLSLLTTHQWWGFYNLIIGEAEFEIAAFDFIDDDELKYAKKLPSLFKERVE